MKKTAKPKKTVQRSQTLFSGMLQRPWEKLPPDTLLSRQAIAKHAGVNVRTIQRHAERGLLPSGTLVAKSDVEKWLRGVGEFKMGRPSMVRFRNARQRVLQLD